MPNNMKKPSNNDSKNGNVRSSTKRPRAPIACFRCHHKKVRCDGAHPNCMRCSSTGVLCAYPSSRRSRTTQPTNIDPFIDNLSHLEARIRRIESDLESQKSMVHSMVSPTSMIGDEAAHELNSKMLKTEMEVQDSRSILAQLRLRGEQRISRGKRAAAAAAAAAVANNNMSNEPMTDKVEKIKNRQPSNTKSTSTKANANSKKLKQSLSSSSQYSTTSSIDSDKTITPSTMADHSKQMYSANNPFYFQGMMLDNNTDLSAFDQPPGHGMDWTLFDQHHTQQQQQLDDYNIEAVDGINKLFATHAPVTSNATGHHLLFPEQQKTMMDISPGSSRSSSLTSNLGYPVILQPSNSTTSTTSNATTTTTCSSTNSCENVFGYPTVNEIILQHPSAPMSQDIHMLSNNPAVWYYPS